MVPHLRNQNIKWNQVYLWKSLFLLDDFKLMLCNSKQLNFLCKVCELDIFAVWGICDLQIFSFDYHMLMIIR